MCFCILLQDIGAGKGRYYAVNFPLRDGIDDDCYETVFEPVSLIVFLELYKFNNVWFLHFCLFSG